jgi:predicted membrane-bound dolichyl-phosphate-mannose-protein mannosyltransferase
MSYSDQFFFQLVGNQITLMAERPRILLRLVSGISWKKKSYFVLIIITLISLLFRLFFTVAGQSGSINNSEFFYFSIVQSLLHGSTISCSPSSYSITIYFCELGNVPLVEFLTVLEISILHNSPLVLRFNTIVLSTATIPITYFVINKLTPSPIVGLLGGLILGTDGYYAYFTSVALPEAPAIFFLLAGIVIYLYVEKRWRFLLGGALLGLAMLSDIGAIFSIIGLACFHIIFAKDKKRFLNTLAMVLFAIFVFVICLQTFDSLFTDAPSIIQQFPLIYHASLTTRQAFASPNWSEFSSISNFNLLDWITLYGNYVGSEITLLLLSCSFWVPLAIFALIRKSSRLARVLKPLTLALLLLSWNFAGSFMELFFSVGESYQLYFLSLILASSIGTACIVWVAYEALNRTFGQETMQVLQTVQS